MLNGKCEPRELVKVSGSTGALEVHKTSSAIRSYAATDNKPGVAALKALTARQPAATSHTVST